MIRKHFEVDILLRFNMKCNLFDMQSKETKQSWIGNTEPLEIWDCNRFCSREFLALSQRTLYGHLSKTTYQTISQRPSKTKAQTPGFRFEELSLSLSLTVNFCTEKWGHLASIGPLVSTSYAPMTDSLKERSLISYAMQTI